MAINAQARIVVAGSSNNSKNLDIVVWRFLENGQLDSDFNHHGFVVYDERSEDRAFTVRIDVKNRIVMVGKRNGKNADLIVLRFLKKRLTGHHI